MRTILVGEQNPYGSDPSFTLWPPPAGCSGHRLCRKVLDLDSEEYLRRFNRQNLCAGPWDKKIAHDRAVVLAETRAPLVLLGKRVATAFGLEFEPFTIQSVYGETLAAILPHPSGRCLIWNRPGAFEHGRRTVAILEQHCRDLKFCATYGNFPRILVGEPA